MKRLVLSISVFVIIFLVGITFSILASGYAQFMYYSSNGHLAEDVSSDDGDSLAVREIKGVVISANEDEIKLITAPYTTETIRSNSDTFNMIAFVLETPLIPIDESGFLSGINDAKLLESVAPQKLNDGKTIYMEKHRVGNSGFADLLKTGDLVVVGFDDNDSVVYKFLQRRKSLI